MIGRAAAIGILATFAAVSLGAQPQPPGEWSVTGRVLVAGSGTDLRPVPGIWVTLNRVGDDSAGVVDSVRTAADGGYTIRYQRTGDRDAIYFTDVTYAGVGYFTDPLRGVRVAGEEAELVVFDTISEPGLLRVRGRHVVIGTAARDGERPVVEVFELTNDTSLTIVPRGDTQPVWSVTLPAGATDPEVGAGDLGEHVVRFRDGRAELYAPIAPGLRQLSLRYLLPGGRFPLRIRLDHDAEVLEALIAGEGGRATGAGLHAEGAVELEGERYVRYLSQNAAAGDEIVITPPVRAASRFLVPLALAAVVVVFAGALVYARRTAYPSPHN